MSDKKCSCANCKHINIYRHGEKSEVIYCEWKGVNIPKIVPWGDKKTAEKEGINNLCNHWRDK